MKKRKIYLSFISMLLLCAIAVGVCGCNSVDDDEIDGTNAPRTEKPTERSTQGNTPDVSISDDNNSTETSKPTDAVVYTAMADLMSSISPNKNVPIYAGTVADRISDNVAVSEFALELFKASNKSGENTLISPLSVLCALSMTANGAKGETLAQIETVLGMPIEELNLYISYYMSNLPDNEKYKLSLANSIWFTSDNRFSVNPDFLQTNADYYGADAYKAPFDDSTLNAINNWVNEHTDGMIPEILDNIPAEAVVYLVNALAFDAEWEEIYNKYDIVEGEFTKEDGSKQKADFMYSTEYSYIEDEKATGFIKYYKDRKYAFAAMLPNEGVSIDEYIAALDGKSLNEILSAPQEATVQTLMPKFKTEYSVQMSEILKSMGITDAFDSIRANLSGLGSSTNGSLFISRVIHKTFIEVNEKGTKAGAATLIEVTDESVSIPDDLKQVYLDRPFVYMLIDCENNIPFFIGTMMDVEQ